MEAPGRRAIPGAAGARARAALAGALLTLLAPAAAAQLERGESREPCTQHDPLRQPLFGDLHVHTRWSLDASTQGTRTTPDQAYRFARGAPLGLQPWSASGEPGREARLERPLDFAAVTDHSELFGEVAMCGTPGSPGHDSFVCRVYRGWPRIAFFFMNARGQPRFGFCGHDGAACLEAARGPWREMQDAAEAAYDRSSECRFTSLIGYEWTRSVQTASNLHRNVIFRSHQVPEAPASSTDHPTPESLWDALDRDCRQGVPGCEALVIPHNSNLSSGFMFAPVTSDGDPLSRADALRRARNEPVVEIMQHKGDSECGAASADELCGFEKLPYDSFMGRYAAFARREPAPISFTRTALGVGLQEQLRLGANPFAFGVIGSTDTHLGTPGLAGERDYPGHGGAGVPIGEVLPDGLLDPIEYNPGGLAVVWAEENSRHAIFSALRRREVYGTSGPRLVLRLFAGRDLPADLCEAPDMVARAYASGVPMGGELSRDIGGAPVLAVSALRDPGVEGAPGALLQRLQLIKVSIVDGEAREQVIDVAGDPASGARVDERSCTPRAEGFERLCAVWRDPDFDPAMPALYYARVVENPTCRWSTHVCNAAGVDCTRPRTIGAGYAPCCDPAFPRTVQERAWSSPIWYTP